LALQGLCCIDAQGPQAWQGVEVFIRDSRESSHIVDSAMQLLKKAFDDRPACDELLRRHARRWELPRLALVDRNVLRLAAYEMRIQRDEQKTIISEALRLAREFSTAESPRFVNGVLDAVARELRGEALPADEPGGDAGDAEDAKDAGGDDSQAAAAEDVKDDPEQG
jgi:N utilization substance protein B